jgi:hypothetical protein
LLDEVLLQNPRELLQRLLANRRVAP